MSSKPKVGVCIVTNQGYGSSRKNNSLCQYSSINRWGGYVITDSRYNPWGTTGTLGSEYGIQLERRK